jgi:hypothetical protein
MRRLLLFLILIVLGVALVAGAFASCGGSNPPIHADAKVKEAGPDGPNNPFPDVGPGRETVWPDSVADSPWPITDGYTGGSFGCQVDSDCFGQMCCPTPWGVKFCAPSCDLK